MLIILALLPCATAAQLAETDFYAFTPVAPPAKDLAPLVDATTVAAACEKVNNCTGAGQKSSADAKSVSAVKSTCELVATVASLEKGDGTWPNTEEFTLATIDQLLAVRDAICVVADKSFEQSFRQPNGFSAGAEAAGGSAPWSPSSAGLLGATDFFVARAQQEVTTWSVDRLLADICDEKTDRWGGLRPVALMPQTCSWVRTARDAGIGGSQISMPAVVADAKALLRHTSEETLRADAQGLLGGKNQFHLDDTNRDVLTTFAVLGRYVELVIDGVSVTDAVAAWARSQPPQKLSTSCPIRKKPDNTTPDCTPEGVVFKKALLSDEMPFSSLVYMASFFANAFPETIIRVSTDVGYKLDLTISGDPKPGYVVAAVLINGDARNSVLPGEVNIFKNGLKDKVLATSKAALAVSDAWRAARQVWLIAQQVQRGALTQTKSMNAGTAALAIADSTVEFLRASLTAAAELVPSNEVRNKLGDVLGQVKDLDALIYALATQDGSAAAQAAVGVVQLGLKSALGNQTTSTHAAQAVDTVARASNLALALYTSKDPASAQAAIEAVASPAGGYADKRRGTHAMYVTLNGYVGGGGGPEWLLPGAGDGSALQPVAPAIWPTIAVGPEFGWRVSRASAHPWSFGVQAQVLDLGTLAAWRIGSEDTTVVPDVTVGHIFSPGLNLAFGLPNAPFSILVGASVCPQLRSVNSDSTLSVADVTTARLGASIAVDIPVLH